MLTHMPRSKKKTLLLDFSTTYHNQPSDWTRVVVATIFGLLILLLVMVDQLILAGLITLSGLTLALMTTTPTHRYHYQFDKNGLTINNHYHRWSNFRAYSLLVSSEDIKITLYRLDRFKIPLVLHVPYQVMGQTQRILSAHLPQKQTLSESLTDLFLRATRL